LLVLGEKKMSDKTGQIREIAGRIEQFAGAADRERFMEGSGKIAAFSDPEKIALWVKGAIDRLDAAVAQPQREQIMLACGYNCISLNKRPLEAARSRRRKFPDENSFLKAEIGKPPAGMRFELNGRELVQYYTPRTYGRGMRCYCGLMHGLPEGVNASATYCQCSRGFVEKYWEGILGRSVRVDLGPTAVTGADECKFTIHL
jgi:hypothetical protein